MNGNFFILENSIFNYDLDVYEFKIYAYLCMRADIKTKNCFPSACKIADECAISRSKVRRVIASLEKKGLFQKGTLFEKLKGQKSSDKQSVPHRGTPCMRYRHLCAVSP